MKPLAQNTHLCIYKLRFFTPIFIQPTLTADCLPD